MNACDRDDITPCQKCHYAVPLAATFQLVIKSPVMDDDAPPITLCVNCGHDVVEFIYPELVGTEIWAEARRGDLS